MSLIHWLLPARNKPAKVGTESSGLSGSSTENGRPANRKGERMVHRELLYAVVREAMVRSGVLSPSYRFKVLSLDPRGRQFVIMVDLSGDAARETAHLAEIEALIAQAAKARHDIVVTAVYWRMQEHVAVGAPVMKTHVAAPVGESTKGRGPKSYTLLTGFEDTEMSAAPEPARAALSSTQYGDLA